MCGFLDNNELRDKCETVVRTLLKRKFELFKNKQTATLYALANGGGCREITEKLLEKDGAHGLLTFLGGYVLRVMKNGGFGNDDNKYPQGNYLYPLEPSCCIKDKNRDNLNISNVIIKNIVTGGKCHGVICLAANGCQLENIMIDGVKETEGEWREATVKIYTGYGESASGIDIKNIVVKNVESTYADYGVYCNTPIRHCSLKNIYSKNAGREIKLDYPDGFSVSCENRK